MSASSRKTYDTDSLVMRRIFAYDPFTNSPLSTNFILSADVKGVALFKNPLEVLSTFGWYDLPDQILSTQNLTISSVSTTLGYLASTINFFKPYVPSSQQVFLPSTVNGLGTMGYVSSTQLTSTVNGLVDTLGSLGYVSSTQLISTVGGLGNSGYVSSTQLTSSLVGLGTLGYLSSGVILGPIVSTVTGLGSAGYISSTQLASTLEGLGSFGYISTVNTQSTITGLGTIGYVSSTQLTSSLEGLGTLGYISSTQFASTIANLGSLNYISSASLYSTITGNSVYFASTIVGLGSIGYVSSTQIASTVQGLGSAGFISSPVFLGISTSFISSAVIVTSSISTFSLNLQELILGSNSFPFFFMSSVQGLGSASYVSSTQLTSSLTGLAMIGYVSSTQLTSSLTGLATIGYVSSTQLTSTVVGLATSGYVSSTQIVSSLKGLATIGYVSSTQLFSTVGGLATIGYVSSTQLTSTVEGLATVGYVSSTQLFSSVANFVSIRSTFNNNIAGNWSNINFLYQNLTPGCNVNTIRFDMGQIFRNKMLSGEATCKLDIETKLNLQFSYYDTNSRDYQFNTFLVRGSSFVTSNIISHESMTYYILNENPINLPFFFKEKNRFIITDPTILSTLKYQAIFSTISVFNSFGPNVPVTNQLFASPGSTGCVSVVLDNLPTP